MRLTSCFLLIVATFNFSFSQLSNFSALDSLRGIYSTERSFWDWIYTDLNLSIQPDEKFLSGKNTIKYRVLKSHQVMHIDLQEPMKIISVYQDGKILKFTRNGQVHLIRLVKKQKVDDINTLVIEFEGNPHEATKAPWDGGFVWSKDENEKHFVATAVQGIGASTWWPCKDHPQDEVDSMRIHISIPTNLNLLAISNGVSLGELKDENGWTTFSYKIHNPINSYGVTVNIGDYVRIKKTFEGKSGILDLQYICLRDHAAEANGQWSQVFSILKTFEFYFGPYPFYQDGLKIIETPFLGMEHQGAIAYGNGFKNGYLQTDLSASGWGFNFDFILVHEIAHEWFGNSITAGDAADMWIQESFTSYAESLYLEMFYGTRAGSDYVIGTRKKIANDRPIMGIYGVDYAGSTDMYYKGSNMLHTLRSWVNQDVIWFGMLRNLYSNFDKKIVNSKQIENFISKELNLDLIAFFNQYVRDKRVPVLEYKWIDNKLNYRWTNCIAEFDMPLPIYIESQSYILKPTTAWQIFVPKASDFEGVLFANSSFLCTLKKL
jgi:aminopeptidase N